MSKDSAPMEGRLGGKDSHQVPLRAMDLLKALQSNEVEFILIGGFSLAAHGFIRGTKDLDIVPKPSKDNYELLGAVLASLNAKPDLGDMDVDEAPLDLDANGLAQGGNWVLITRLGRLDIMQFIDGVSSYEALRSGAVIWRVPGLNQPILVAGLDDLIAMKLAAGRDQDLIDIAELERARGSSG